MLQITHAHACWFLCTREAQVGSRVRGEREREREREYGMVTLTQLLVATKKLASYGGPGP